MLDFPLNIYKRILSLADYYGHTADCRAYPSLTFNNFFDHRQIPFLRLRSILENKFQNPSFAYGLYVNFPFCKYRCNFCKYYSEIPSFPETIDLYLKALRKELEMYQIDFSRADLRNVYFGGGTPSLLSSGQIDILADILNSFFGIHLKKNKIQITLEGTPESIKEEEIRKWRELGVNRVSLGVQSFNDDILRKSGRGHGTKEVFDALRVLRRAGIKYLGIDLIIGLPGETTESYLETIRQVIMLSPDFIECFFLTLGGAVKLKSLGGGLDLDKIVQMFKNEMVANDYYVYFSGNFLGFVKKGVEPKWANNQNTEGVYRYTVPCLGIGAGAQSHFLDLKYAIPSQVKNYLEIFFYKRPPIFYGFELNQDDSKRQYIISQIGYFRLLDKNAYRQLFKSEFANDFPEEIAALKKENIISEEKDKFTWHLEEKGLGHTSFFMHVIKYWYHPDYLFRLIRYLIKLYLIRLSNLIHKQICRYLR